MYAPTYDMHVCQQPHANTQTYSGKHNYGEVPIMAKFL